MLVSCSREQAERLGSAVRFRTVTITSDVPHIDARCAEFTSFTAFLSEAFPRAAGLLFYAHFDVAPAGDESAWTHPPFSGRVTGGYIWGRGTIDDKCTLMALMEAVESLQERGFRPSRPLYFAFAADEELTRERGAGTIAQSLADRGVRVACVFNEGAVIASGIVPFVSKPAAEEPFSRAAHAGGRAFFRRGRAARTRSLRDRFAIPPSPSAAAARGSDRGRIG